jgi:hypothetical protein
VPYVSLQICVFFFRVLFIVLSVYMDDSKFKLT